VISQVEVKTTSEVNRVVAFLCEDAFFVESTEGEEEKEGVLLSPAPAPLTVNATTAHSRFSPMLLLPSTLNGRPSTAYTRVSGVVLLLLLLALLPSPPPPELGGEAVRLSTGAPTSMRPDTENPAVAIMEAEVWPKPTPFIEPAEDEDEDDDGHEANAADAAAALCCPSEAAVPSVEAHAALTAAGEVHVVTEPCAVPTRMCAPSGVTARAVTSSMSRRCCCCCC
jgi:hypothetical protein